MKILYCIPHLYNSGGMERVLTQKVNWLATHTDHTFTIITTEPTPSGKSDCYFPLDKRVELKHLNMDFDADYHKPLWAKWMGHMRRMRAYRKALAGYIREHHIDLCISLCGKEIAFLRSLPCRTMAELHFSMDQRRQLLMANHGGRLWSLFGKIRTWQLVRAVRPLEQLVVLTEQDKQDWLRAGCRNVTVIPNPCAINDSYSAPEPLRLTTKDQRPKTILAAGRLHEQKGFDLLLQAWKPIEKNHPEWSLRIVGEGPKRAELEAQIKALGLERAVLAGSTNNMENEYAAASLFVLSSRYEGFSLVLSEAMWCGVPCVSFDCPQGPGELLADGRGWLVPNGDIAALSERIAYAISHPEEAAECAHRAQQYAHNRYSEQTIMPKWVKLIENHI